MAFGVRITWTAILLAVSECSSFTLTSPAFRVQRPAHEPLRISFDSDSPVTASEIRELNRAQALSTTRAPHGQGTRCAAELRTTQRADTNFVFACAAHAQSGETQFALAVVAVVGDAWRQLNASVVVDADSLRVVVAPYNATCNATCKFRHADAPAWRTPGACALGLRDVSSGLVLAQARCDHAIFMHAHAHVVSAAPDATSLTLTLDREDDVYEDGDWALASCDIGTARPAARLSILLDNVAIEATNGESDASTPMIWQPPWTALASSLRVRVQLHAAHNGTEFVCVAQHAALPSPGDVRVARRVSVSARAVDAVRLGAVIGGAVALGLLVVMATAGGVWCWRVRGRGGDGAAVYRADAEHAAAAVRDTTIYEDLDFAQTQQQHQTNHDDNDIYDDVELTLPSDRYLRAQHSASRPTAPALPPKRRR